MDRQFDFDDLCALETDVSDDEMQAFLVHLTWRTRRDRLAVQPTREKS